MKKLLNKKIIALVALVLALVGEVDARGGIGFGFGIGSGYGWGGRGRYWGRLVGDGVLE
ncbi:hypothetical protein Noda2021_10330 [Candidatus Dependentiae bacterium Noda2021]|nr:hypothetical protein Noda2021_10330 [Candidatus Dependentiae bacterium Noda2021]